MITRLDVEAILDDGVVVRSQHGGHLGLSANFQIHGRNGPHATATNQKDVVLFLF